MFSTAFFIQFSKSALASQRPSLSRWLQPFHTRACTNDTPLHTMMRSCTTQKELHRYINKHPANIIATMAQTTNNDGETALDLIPKLNLEYSDGMKVEITLFTLLKNQKNKPFAELVCVDNVLKRHKPLNEAERVNVELACAALNHTRQVIKYSSTHPDYNQFSAALKNEVTTLLSKVRAGADHDTKTPEEIYRLCKQHAAGNCTELSYCVIHFLMKHATTKLYANIVEIDNGDHAFVVFGPHPLSNANQYGNHDTAVLFCDPWSGTIGRYNQHDLCESIGDFKLYRFPNYSRLNVVTTFNPAFHRLTTLATYQLQENIAQNRPNTSKS